MVLLPFTCESWVSLGHSVFIMEIMVTTYVPGDSLLLRELRRNMWLWQGWNTLSFQLRADKGTGVRRSFWNFGTNNFSRYQSYYTGYLMKKIQEENKAHLLSTQWQICYYKMYLSSLGHSLTMAVSTDHGKLQAYSYKHNATNAKLVEETSQLAIISSKKCYRLWWRSMKWTKSASFLCSKNHYDFFTLASYFVFCWLFSTHFLLKVIVVYSSVSSSLVGFVIRNKPW